ncbi:MAG: hypothetical protein WDN04_16350 [Rhodospirillales bacterium]
MRQTPLQRSMHFLGFSVAVAMAAYGLEDFTKMTVRDWRHAMVESARAAGNLQTTLQGDSTCFTFHIVAT